MSVRNSKPSFLLMEEAPTLRLLNMHRIPATLRSYDIATIYVMQDKIQNDMMYGDKASMLPTLTEGIKGFSLN